MPPQTIAVLGGGLTGLSATFYLARRFPAAHIALYNADARFGGWVRSQRVCVPHLDDTHVLLEAGPRTLRPHSRALLELIHLLGLAPTLLTIKKTAAAARSRFLYVPERGGLVRLPAAPSDLLRDLFLDPSGPAGAQRSISRLLLSCAVREPFRRRNRPGGLDDESVDAFLARRFGEEFARVFGSALVHGVYAADARWLSVRAAFPSLWEAEDRGGGSVVRGSLKRGRREEAESYEVGDLEERMRDVSVYSFTDGIGTLTSALEDHLRRCPRVRLHGGVGITGLRINPWNKQFELTTTGYETVLPTHVVSALPLFQLHPLLTPATHLPHLTTHAYTSVTVVNLVFARPPPTASPLHPDGFGYLVPRPRDGYGSSTRPNPGILGCVFDSCSTSAQDSTDRVVKMTVMLGGPYHAAAPCAVDVPTVLDALSAQLGRRLPAPLASVVHRHARCIPLYGVGHLTRMEELRAVLAREPWAARMEVLGAGVGGASVGECVEAGRGAGAGWT